MLRGIGGVEVCGKSRGRVADRKDAGMVDFQFNGSLMHAREGHVDTYVCIDIPASNRCPVIVNVGN